MEIMKVVISLTPRRASAPTAIAETKNVGNAESISDFVSQPESTQM